MCLLRIEHKLVWANTANWYRKAKVMFSKQQYGQEIKVILIEGIISMYEIINCMNYTYVNLQLHAAVLKVYSTCLKHSKNNFPKPAGIQVKFQIKRSRGVNISTNSTDPCSTPLIVDLQPNQQPSTTTLQNNFESIWRAHPKFHKL